MATVKFDIEPLDNYYKSIIDVMERKYPKKVEEILIEIANELMERAKMLTPEDTKKTRKKWKVGKVRKKGGGFFIEVKNTSPLAHLLEDGHNFVAPNGEITGYYQGKNMLLISTTELQNRLPNKLMSWLDNLLDEVSL